MAGAGYRLFTAGQVLTAAQVNTYLEEQAVMNFATSAARDAALTSVKSEGNVTYQLDANSLTVYSGAAWSTIGPVHGACTAWTPAIVQSGAVSSTVAGTPTYQRIGRMIYYNAVVTITSTGTGANAVTCTLPVTSKAYTTNYDILGHGYVADLTGATSRFTAELVPASTTTVKFQAIFAAGNNDLSFLGVAGFTAALAAGDVIGVNGFYEAAADA